MLTRYSDKEGPTGAERHVMCFPALSDQSEHIHVVSLELTHCG